MARFPSLHGRVRPPPTLSGTPPSSVEAPAPETSADPAPPGRCWLASSAAPWGVGAGAIIGPPIQNNQKTRAEPVEISVHLYVESRLWIYCRLDSSNPLFLKNGGVGTMSSQKGKKSRPPGTQKYLHTVSHSHTMQGGHTTMQCIGPIQNTM